MTVGERTTRTTVEFAHPFVLNEGDDEMPSGQYVIETEEEVIPGLSFLAYRRVRTTMTTPPTARGVTLQRQVQTIDPSALEAALARDAERGLQEATQPSHQTRRTGL